MRHATLLIPALAVGALLAGCSGSGNDPNQVDFTTLVASRNLPVGDADCPGGGTVIERGTDTDRDGTLDSGEVESREFLECVAAPQLRAVHASPDAPDVNVLVNGNQALADVPYGTGSGFLDVTPSTQVQVEAIVPGGNQVVIDETLTLEFETEYTVLATGDVAAPIAPLVITNPAGETIMAGSLRVQVVHAAPDAPPVDVYVTAPSATLASSTPINTAPLAFREFTDRLQVQAGDYRIRVTPAGAQTPVVYDSGTVTLAAGADLLVAALENTGTGDNLVELLALDGQGSALLLDADKPAAVLPVHASPDAPAVDVLADDDATAADEALPLATNVPFAAFCAVEAVPAPADYTISVTAAGDPSTVALTFPFEAVPGAETVAIVTGLLTSTPPIQVLPLAADTRSVATETKIRVTHAAGGTGDVDVYLLPDGSRPTSPEVTPTFAAVPFTGTSGIQSVAPGTYDVFVTPADTSEVVAIEIQDLVLSAGQVLDVIARDPDDDMSEGTLPQVIVIDYATIGDC